jgi:adenylate cyclase
MTTIRPVGHRISATRDSILAARVAQVAILEAWRNERRINVVRVGLVVAGVAMVVAFRLWAGPTVHQTMLWQLAVLSLWLLMGIGIGALGRRARMPLWLPYLSLSSDLVLISAMVAVRMITTPGPFGVDGGILAERMYLMLFPVLISAGLRFELRFIRFAEAMAILCTVALVVVDITLLGWQFRPFWVLITLLALVGTGRFTALVTVRGRRLITETVKIEREREFVRSTFARYVSSDVARTLLEGDLASLRRGSSREVTILFSDIRDFTRMSESMEPEAVVAFLNGYFEAMVGAVFDCGGTIDKFMGDGIMAVFGAPVEREQHAELAARAALAMRSALARLNVHRRVDGLEPIRIGVGLHMGQCVVGAIGAEQRLDFTAVGDAVNLASRVEGLTKEIGADILVSAAVAQRLPPSFELISHTGCSVRGKREPVDVYELAAGPAGPPDQG